MAFSDYAANAIMAWERGTAMPTAPAGLYCQLHTGDPSGAGTANVAQLSTRKTVTMGTPSGRTETNTADVGPWTTGFANETIAYVSIWDAVSGGNCLRTGQLTTPRTTTTSATDFHIPTGSLSFTTT